MVSYVVVGVASVERRVCKAIVGGVHPACDRNCVKCKYWSIQSMDTAEILQKKIT